MNTGLPDKIDPLGLADENADLVGFVPLTGSLRLGRTMDQASKYRENDVQIELHFRSSEDGNRTVGGKAAAQVSAICQPCLKPMVLRLVGEVNYVLRSQDEADCCIERA